MTTQEITETAEEYGPPAPLRLFTYRFFHPAYHQWQVLDCSAVTVDGALASAVRFMRREYRRIKPLGLRVQIPSHTSWMRREG